jgi:predicted GH43/DUF377 family glycosyl hydrolase
MFTITRDENNPLLSPTKEHPWEAAATYNGSPVRIDKRTIALVYRAQSDPDPFMDSHISLSTIGVARSKNNGPFTDRRQLVVPDQDFDRYGCEDPRVTFIDGNYYIFYTALGTFPFSKEGIKVAVAISSDLKTVKEKHLVTPFNAKAFALFPEKINGKYAALLTLHSDEPPSEICYVEFNSIEDIWSEKFWNKWYEGYKSSVLPLRRRDGEHLEVGAVPVRTEEGWLCIYGHIQRYGSSDALFGVEAVLLDAKKPMKVIGATKGPFLVPDWYYEHVGYVRDVVFATGALIDGDRLAIYYGTADTFCARAYVSLKPFLAALMDTADVFTRAAQNPIITPREGVRFEQGGTCNPAAIELKGKVYILYRAVSDQNISTIGLAISSDGITIDERLDAPIYAPRIDAERMGCEDPRIFAIKDRLYIFYTAYDGYVPRIAVSSISAADFLARKWDAWKTPSIITPGNIPDKDSAMIPERTRDGYMIFHRAGNGVCADFFKTTAFDSESINKCIRIMDPRRGTWDGNRIGIAAPAIKTDKGWLLLYHGISWSSIYRVGAALLDLKDPSIVLARTAIPIFEPTEPYELEGVVNNVVFPCGAIVRKGVVYMYYGGADKVVGVATLSLKSLLSYFS